MPNTTRPIIFPDAVTDVCTVTAHECVTKVLALLPVKSHRAVKVQVRVKLVEGFMDERDAWADVHCVVPPQSEFAESYGVVTSAREKEEPCGT